MNVALPKFVGPQEEQTHLRQLIKGDETLSSAVIRNEDISLLVCKGFSANELRLERIQMTEARLEKTGFTDVELIHCRLSASTLTEASWRRVLVQDTQCLGLQLQNSTLKDVTFAGCKLAMVNFRFAKLTNVLFKDCTLDDGDFYATTLQSVIFQNCSMHKAEFSNAKLKQVDLRSSDIATIAGVSNLAGATIDSIQLVALAPLLASELKIIVSDN